MTSASSAIVRAMDGTCLCYVSQIIKWVRYHAHVSKPLGLHDETLHEKILDIVEAQVDAYLEKVNEVLTLLDKVREMTVSIARQAVEAQLQASGGRAREEDVEKMVRMYSYNMYNSIVSPVDTYLLYIYEELNMLRSGLLKLYDVLRGILDMKSPIISRVRTLLDRVNKVCTSLIKMSPLLTSMYVYDMYQTIEIGRIVTIDENGKPVLVTKTVEDAKKMLEEIIMKRLQPPAQVGRQ